jgi:hypothetical protein
MPTLDAIVNIVDGSPDSLVNVLAAIAKDPPKETDYKLLDEFEALLRLKSSQVLISSLEKRKDALKLRHESLDSQLLALRAKNLDLYFRLGGLG